MGDETLETSDSNDAIGVLRQKIEEIKTERAEILSRLEFLENLLPSLERTEAMLAGTLSFDTWQKRGDIKRMAMIVLKYENRPMTLKQIHSALATRNVETSPNGLRSVIYHDPGIFIRVRPGEFKLSPDVEI